MCMWVIIHNSVFSIILWLLFWSFRFCSLKILFFTWEFQHNKELIFGKREQLNDLISCSILYLVSMSEPFYQIIWQNGAQWNMSDYWTIMCRGNLTLLKWFYFDSLMCGLWDVVRMKWLHSNMHSMQRTWTLWCIKFWRARWEYQISSTKHAYNVINEHSVDVDILTHV